MAEATVRISTTTKKRFARAAATTAEAARTLLELTATAFAAEQPDAWRGFADTRADTGEAGPFAA